jgi:dTDP-4-amino-4,6-dideoxygalactose transaminase
VTPIEFHRPHLATDTAARIAEVLASGHLRGDGAHSARVAERLSSMLDGAEVLLTPSCTDALELAALLVDVGPGDEVVMPSFTFPSTATAVALRGATPVFADIDPLTLGITARTVEPCLTDRTRAVVVVHYGAAAGDPDDLVRLTADRGLHLVEDAALAFGARWRDRPLGSFGAISTLSFHETKGVQCGEGGALVLNDRSLVERAEVLREKGTDRRAFARGRVGRYTWVDLGSSDLLAEPLAAILEAQLDEWPEVDARRRSLWRRYHDGLAAWSQRVGAQLPHDDPRSTPSAQSFHVVLARATQRDRFIEHLADRAVGSTFHYVPLHDSTAGRRYGRSATLPVTESVAARLVRLPLYADLTDDEADRVIAAADSFAG